MRELRQSTAVTVMLGPFLDSVDGNTVEGALTITQPDIRLSKNGGAFAQKNAAQTLAHAENGWYPASLNATDTNTLGVLTVVVHESGALQTFEHFAVVRQDYWDAKYGAGAGFTELAAVKAKTDNLPSDPADHSLVIAATDAVLAAVSAKPTATENADALLNRADGVEVSYTLREAMRLLLAVARGAPGAGGLPGTFEFRDPSGTKVRLSGSLDANGLRSGVTVDTSDV